MGMWKSKNWFRKCHHDLRVYSLHSFYRFPILFTLAERGKADDVVKYETKIVKRTNESIDVEYFSATRKTKIHAQHKFTTQQTSDGGKHEKNITIDIIWWMNKIVWMNEQEQDWHAERWQTISVEQKSFSLPCETIRNWQKTSWNKIEKKITVEATKQKKLKLHKSR